MHAQTLFVPLLTAALGVNALPSDLVERQSVVAQLQTFSNGACLPNTATGSIAITNTTACQVIIPGAIGGEILQLPSGCSLTFFSNGQCSSVNSINVPTNVPVGSCFGFGGTSGIASVRARCT